MEEGGALFFKDALSARCMTQAVVVSVDIIWVAVEKYFSEFAHPALLSLVQNGTVSMIIFLRLKG